MIVITFHPGCLGFDARSSEHYAGKKNPVFTYTWGDGDLLPTESEKDVGVMITSNLKPSVQCATAAKKGNMVQGQLARGVTYRDRSTFIRLYKAFVLPHLSYVASAWSPFNKADKEVLEKNQKRAVLMVTNVRGCYEERLAVLKLRTLEDRRVRGDMIETYKILTGKCKVSLDTWFCLAKERDGVVSTRSTLGFLNLVLPPVPESDLKKNWLLTT